LVILLFVIDNGLVKTISDELIEIIFKSVPTLTFKPLEANMSTLLLLVFILQASLPKYILKYWSVPEFVHPNSTLFVVPTKYKLSVIVSPVFKTHKLS